MVRANPRAATARQPDLAADLDLVLRTLLRRQGGMLASVITTVQGETRDRPSAAARVLIAVITGYRRLSQPAAHAALPVPAILQWLCA